MAKKYDCAGWATRYNIKCADGRTIKPAAFADQDGQTVPLIWNHDHVSAFAVLGKAVLEHRDEGVYAYCSFNQTEQGQHAKVLVEHGDINAFSIHANHLQGKGSDVSHGVIRELSLVLAGANKGALIEDVVTHSEELGIEGEAYIYNCSETLEIFHSDAEEINEEKTNMEEKEIIHAEEETQEANKDEKTIAEVVETMNEEQQTAMYYLIGKALEDAEKTNENNKEDAEMKHNAFENENNTETLSHAEVMEAVADAKRYGSMKDSFLAHGITNIDYLFPDAKNLTDKPGFINTNPSGWVDIIMKGVHHTPFSRVKMVFADITADEARAKGYIKGNEKTDEVFSLLKRVVDPTTVYKKQSFDRDDIIDITEFDVIPWIKGEMRMKLDEELARAYIFGDKRLTSSPDKINETKIIPVVKDTNNNLYAMVHNVEVGATDVIGELVIDETVRSMDKYEGSGNITFFTSAAYVTEMLLLKDKNKRRIYNTMEELATALGVDKIVKVPATFLDDDVLGVYLDLADYNVGADKGGNINMFDDFDIDYNKEKYLIETRCSGALSKPHSAVVLKKTAKQEAAAA